MEMTWNLVSTTMNPGSEPSAESPTVWLESAVPLKMRTPLLLSSSKVGVGLIISPRPGQTMATRINRHKERLHMLFGCQRFIEGNSIKTGSESHAFVAVSVGVEKAKSSP